MRGFLTALSLYLFHYRGWGLQLGKPPQVRERHWVCSGKSAAAVCTGKTDEPHTRTWCTCLDDKALH